MKSQNLSQVGQLSVLTKIWIHQVLVNLSRDIAQKRCHTCSTTDLHNMTCKCAVSPDQSLVLPQPKWGEEDGYGHNFDIKSHVIAVHEGLTLCLLVSSANDNINLQTVLT